MASMRIFAFEKLQMKHLTLLICLCFGYALNAQGIQVDSETFTPQQLIEDILIDSDCIENVVVSNVVGGNFNGTEQSYGYFDATGTSFPFQSGIVLSTGRLSNVPGPNTSLSDDDAPGWLGDMDLELVLNESNTLNATIIEFDFTSVASEVSFRYIFASEEYQEGNPNTCIFSDLFGFLIRPIAEQEYTNIAVVPNTQTPVKVTTVHPEIPGACEAENEFYFESWNGTNVPINFNGQTKILTATAQVIPNETYHVKLVIADEQNFRFDSAVFLEAGSFQLSTNLGPDRLLATGNPLCENETLELDAFEPNASSYKWFRNGIENDTETNSTFLVTEPGTYNVEVTLDNNCVAFGEIIIEYANNPTALDSILVECDQDQDGLTLYNLSDIEDNVTNNDNSSFVTDFFLIENDAISDVNAISNAEVFENTSPGQVVFARVENQIGCFDVAEVELQISNNLLNIDPLEACDGEIIDGFAVFDLNEIAVQIESQIPANATLNFYETETDAFQNTNALNPNYENVIPDAQTIFVKVESNNQCFSISAVALQVLETPELSDDEIQYYCLNTFPDKILLSSGVIDGFTNDYSYQWFLDGVDLGENSEDIEINVIGEYTVIVSNGNGCSASRTITVSPSNIATIENIIIQDGATSNTVIIEVSGEGTYQYALNGFDAFFQDSNILTNVPPGFQTILIGDKNGCGIISETIAVIGFPKFFTPNGDTYNDFWHVYGVNSEYNRGIDIKVFDRYGKLLKQFDHTSQGWDGTLNGQGLPSDDYWFIAKLVDGRTFKGHFTLKR